MSMTMCIREPLNARRDADTTQTAAQNLLERGLRFQAERRAGATLSPLFERLSAVFPDAGVTVLEIDESGRRYVAWHTHSIRECDAVESAVLNHYNLRAHRRVRMCRIGSAEDGAVFGRTLRTFNCALVIRFQSQIDGLLYVFAVSLERPGRRIPPEEELLLATHTDDLVDLLETIKACISHELGSAFGNAATARAPWGILAIGATGRVCFSSLRTRQMLSRRTGLYIKQGRLQFERAAVARTFDQILDTLSAWNEEADSNAPAPRALSIPGPRGEISYALSLTPIASNWDRPGDAVVIGYLSDLLERVAAQRPLLATIFSLTAKEAHLAELFGSGHNLEQAATMMGISRNTARIHLSNIFSKTATHSQVELARLLARLPSTSATMDDEVPEEFPETDCLPATVKRPDIRGSAQFRHGN